MDKQLDTLLALALGTLLGLIAGLLILNCDLNTYNPCASMNTDQEITDCTGDWSPADPMIDYPDQEYWYFKMDESKSGCMPGECE